MNNKLTVLAVMLVMAVLSIPAIAQVEEGTGDKAAGGGSPEPPPAEPPVVESVIPEQPVSSPEPAPVEAPVVDTVVPEQPVSSPEPAPVEPPPVDSGSPEPPAGDPDDSVSPEQPVEAPPADDGGEPEAGDPVIDTGPAEWEVEDQKADRDEQRDWEDRKADRDEQGDWEDRKAGINQRRFGDRAIDCEPGDRGFPFFCFDDDDDDFFDDEIDQEAESGDIEQEIDISLSGDNSNQCVAVLQFGNTGNNQNALGFGSFGSPFFDDRFRDFDDDRFRDFDDGRFRDFEDIEFEDAGQISFAPEFENVCEQSIQQTAVAGGRPGAARARGVTPQPVVARALAGARGATISPSRAVPASLGRATTAGRLTGRLPRTGGIGPTSLLTLGIGGLLIGGGLLARRLSR